MRKAGHDSMAYTAKAKRGEDPLDLPIYGIDQIVANERTRKATALLQTEVFAFDGETSALISRNVFYKSKPSVDRNLLICGDNLEVMQRLYDEYGSFLDLVYIDPPFCSNRLYDNNRRDRSNGGFSDKWVDGKKTYLPWLNERLVMMHRLIKPTGSLFIHLDWHVGHYVRPELDKIFGEENFVNEIIWAYQGTGAPNKGYKRKHDMIFFYAKKASDMYFDVKIASEPPSEKTLAKFTMVDEEGRRYKQYRHPDGSYHRQYLDPTKMVRKRDTWNISTIQSWNEKTGYSTQKSEALLREIIAASTPEEAIVADFFLGSGTACVVSQKLGRRWIGVDQNPQAIEVAADRIRRISRQKDKAVGIEIPDFTVATSRGYSKFYASHYHREDVLTIDDTRKGNSLSEFQQFILDCYLPRDGRKGDAAQ
jgi:DNA modification methylase